MICWPRLKVCRAGDIVYTLFVEHTAAVEEVIDGNSLNRCQDESKILKYLKCLKNWAPKTRPDFSWQSATFDAAVRHGKLNAVEGLPWAFFKAMKQTHVMGTSREPRWIQVTAKLEQWNCCQMFSTVRCYVAGECQGIKWNLGQGRSIQIAIALALGSVLKTFEQPWPFVDKHPLKHAKTPQEYK